MEATAVRSSTAKPRKGLVITAADMAARWRIEQCPSATALIGQEVRIEAQEINPMLRLAVITLIGGSTSNPDYHGVFSGKIRPQVSLVEKDIIICSFGIVARRVEAK